MENVIVIEQKTFEELMARFNRLAGMVDRFCRKAEEKRLSEWLSRMSNGMSSNGTS